MLIAFVLLGCKCIAFTNVYYGDTTFMEKPDGSPYFILKNNLPSDEYRVYDIRYKYKYNVRKTIKAKKYIENNKHTTLNSRYIFLREVCSYIDNKKNGESLRYSSSAYKTSLIERTWYSMGAKSGIQYTWFDTGEPESIIKYEQGKRTDSALFYYRSGTKHLVLFFENDSIVSWKSFYETGSFSSAKKNGILSDTILLYYPNQKTKYKAIYHKSGQLTFWSKYDQKGERIEYAWGDFKFNYTSNYSKNYFCYNCYLLNPLPYSGYHSISSSCVKYVDGNPLPCDK